jgi:hypothetical protein
MSIAIIQTLLDDKVATLSPPSFNKENTQITSQVKAAYSRATLLPRESVSYGGQNGATEVGGLYQIDLFYPQGTGVAAANAMADSIVAAFKAAMFLTGSGVTVQIQQAWRDAGTTQGHFYSAPVVIRWVSYQ